VIAVSGAPGFVQAVSRILGLKSERPVRGVARQREFLAIAPGQQQRNRLALNTVGRRGESHGDNRLSGDDVTLRAEHVRQ
jgi:hypothetical protein